MMKTTTSTTRKAERAVPSPKKREQEMFWHRASNAELDRSGDFILKNLEQIRKEAAARGDTR